MNLKATRPDLDTSDLLKAHATWALKSVKAIEAGDPAIDMHEYIRAWEKPVHPLAQMFGDAISNGHPVSIINGDVVTRYNQEITK